MVKRMTEYIERESVLDALSVFNDYDNGNEHFLYGIETAREIVESVQAIDVQSVKHGRWVDDIQCSNCGWYMEDDVTISPMMVFFDYCPNCGAKMEAGDEK